MFGWSYPPGCSGTPYDEEEDVSELQDKVLGILEDAGIPTAFCDQIIKILDEAERDAICSKQERIASGE